MAKRASARVLRALAVFGLSVPRAEGAFANGEERAARRAAARGLWALRSMRREAEGARCVVLAGASGTGKSAALRLMERALRRRGVKVVRAEVGVVARLTRERRAAVELIEGGLTDALSALARAGLSDAVLLARPARLLSEGQRWRLALAMAVRRAERGCGGARGNAQRPGVVIADELCAGLDLATACGVLRGVSGRSGVVVIGATSREDLIEAIGAMPRWRVIEVR